MTDSPGTGIPVPPLAPPGQLPAATPPMIPGMKHSREFSKIFAAFTKAQGEWGALVKSLVATIKGDKGEYQYQYADLAQVLEAILPALHKHEMGVLQPLRVKGRCVKVDTILIHSSGEWIGTAEPMEFEAFTHSNQAQQLQNIGIASAYFKRYSLISFVAIASEKDTDGNGVGNGGGDGGNRGNNNGGNGNGNRNRNNNQNRGNQQQGQGQGQRQQDGNGVGNLKKPGQDEQPKVHPNLLKLGNVLRGPYQCESAGDYTLLIQYALDDRTKDADWLKDNPNQVDTFLAALSKYATDSNLKPEELLARVKECESTRDDGRRQ